MIPILRKQQIEDYLTKLRDSVSDATIAEQVKTIIADVKADGDTALRAYAKRFDGFDRAQFLLTEDERDRLANSLGRKERQALEFAASNIGAFASEVCKAAEERSMELEGYRLGLRFQPVQSAACYVPGGRFPLPSTALMTAVTARSAGVPDVAIISPAMTPSVVYAGQLAGVERFYQLGGAQAVAAGALGTEQIPRFDMIAGPGNAYVTEAKKQLQGQIGIDMLAGPSEVAIIADDSAPPELLAADLLAQAEHDTRARAWLVTESMDLAEAVTLRLTDLFDELALGEEARESLAGSAIFVVTSEQEAIELTNSLAPEHLQLMVNDEQAFRRDLQHFGSLFAGSLATVAQGDYAAGVNHTLPTGMSARFSSTLSPLSFLRTQTWLEVTGDTKLLNERCAVLAELEGLRAHAHSVRIRI